MRTLVCEDNLPRPFPTMKLTTESNLPGREFYLSQLTEWDFCQTLMTQKSHFSKKITCVLTIYLEKWEIPFGNQMAHCMPFGKPQTEIILAVILTQFNFSTLISLFS